MLPWKTLPPQSILTSLFVVWSPECQCSSPETALYTHFLQTPKPGCLREDENLGELETPLISYCCWGFHLASCEFFVSVYKVKEIMSNLNPIPNKPWFLRVCCTTLLKTLWEKEELLVTSNFSFSHSVFYLFEELSTIYIEFEIVVCKLFQIGRVKNSLFGKGLTNVLFRSI